MAITINSKEVSTITFNSKPVNVVKYNYKTVFAPDGYIDIYEYLDAIEAIETAIINNSTETDEQKKIYEAAVKIADMGRSVNISYLSSNFDSIYGAALSIDIDDTTLFPETAVSVELKSLFKQGTEGVTLLIMCNDFIDISHFWCALEGYLRDTNVCTVDSLKTTTYPMCGSWLGDSLSLAADIKNGKTGNEITFLNDESSFSNADWLSDIEASTVAWYLANTDMKLSEILRNQFLSVIDRGSYEYSKVLKFLNNRGSIDTLYEAAKTNESTALLAAEYMQFNLISMSLAVSGQYDTTYLPLVLTLIKNYISSLGISLTYPS